MIDDTEVTSDEEKEEGTDEAGEATETPAN